MNELLFKNAHIGHTLDWIIWSGSVLGSAGQIITSDISFDIGWWVNYCLVSIFSLLWVGQIVIFHLGSNLIFSDEVLMLVGLNYMCCIIISWI
jgi:hypothetical protein